MKVSEFKRCYHHFSDRLRQRFNLIIHKWQYRILCKREDYKILDKVNDNQIKILIKYRGENLVCVKNIETNYLITVFSENTNALSR